MDNSFVFYSTMRNQINELPEDLQLKFLKIIINYGLDGTEPEDLSPLEKALWIGLKKDIDYTKERRNSSIENGKKGGRPKTENNLEKPNLKNENLKVFDEKPKKPNEKNENLNVNVNVNENVNENVNTQGDSDESECACAEKTFVSTPKKNTKFEKPTVSEVEAYCKERNNGLSAQEFWDFYESKGWKVGNSPMKNWQACVRTWEQRRKTDDSGGHVKKHGTMWGNESEIPDEMIAIFNTPVGRGAG